MKLKRIFILVFMLLAFIVVFFKPHNILTNEEEAGIGYISYNSNYNQEKAELELVNNTEYDENKVLECIAKYKEYRTLRSVKSYKKRNVQLEILYYTEDKFRMIHLGNSNYSFEANDKHKSQKSNIVNGDSLRDELLILIGRG